jgi:hypothetical protein
MSEPQYVIVHNRHDTAPSNTTVQVYDCRPDTSFTDVQDRAEELGRQGVFGRQAARNLPCRSARVRG